MAGGLFAVYRDTGAPRSSHAASRRAGGGPTPSSSNNNNNNNNIRQKGAFAVLRDTPKLNEKENLDPVARPIGKLGKGIVHKKAHPIPVAADCNASRGAFGHKSVQRSHNAPTVVSANGICTGTLKTRVLPPLPPLEEPLVAARSVDRARLVSPVAPSRIGTTSPVRATGVVRSEACDSPASNVDSGYGRASDCDDRSIDTVEEVQGATFDDESDMSIEVDTNELNRRARALTESPLAEITQAFTGLGRFSNNLPGSPSPLSTTTVAAPSPSLTRTDKKTKKTCSPSRSMPALPPSRLRPYSTTATTRKVKPGQTAPEPPTSEPPSRSSSALRSLRF
ncbi:hypothetical protein JCM3766R1_006924 [Sporobolomyces carnicolor]